MTGWSKIEKIDLKTNTPARKIVIHIVNINV
jgi:hypothetical protein